MRPSSWSSSEQNSFLHMRDTNRRHPWKRSAWEMLAIYSSTGWTCSHKTPQHRDHRCSSQKLVVPGEQCTIVLVNFLTIKDTLNARNTVLGDHTRHALHPGIRFSSCWSGILVNTQRQAPNIAGVQVNVPAIGRCCQADNILTLCHGGQAEGHAVPLSCKCTGYITSQPVL